MALPRNLQLTEQIATYLTYKQALVCKNGQSIHLHRKEMKEQTYSETEKSKSMWARLNDSLVLFCSLDQIKIKLGVSLLIIVRGLKII